MNRRTLASTVLTALFLQGARVVYTRTTKPPEPLGIQIFYKTGIVGIHSL